MINLNIRIAGFLTHTKRSTDYVRHHWQHIRSPIQFAGLPTRETVEKEQETEIYEQARLGEERGGRRLVVSYKLARRYTKSLGGVGPNTRARLDKLRNPDGGRGD